MFFFSRRKPKPVYYEEIRLGPSVDDPKRLVFVAAPASPPPPDDMVALREDYMKVARVAAILFKDDKETRNEIFGTLHGGADRGLRGPDFSIVDGRANLEEAKADITDFAYKVRDKRFTEYAWLGAIFGLVPLIVGFVINWTNGFGRFAPPAGNGGIYEPDFALALAAFWVASGASFAVLGEFLLRFNQDLTYETLLTMDLNRWRPRQRLFMTIFIAYIFAFLLKMKLVQVGVNGSLLNDFTDKTPLLGLLVGGITGFAFVTVREIILRIKPHEEKS